MVTISQTLKNRIFWMVKSFLALRESPVEGQNLIFDRNNRYMQGQKFFSLVENKKFFENLLELLLSYPGIYFGTSGTIWSLRKMIFGKKSLKKS